MFTVIVLALLTGVVALVGFLSLRFIPRKALGVMAAVGVALLGLYSGMAGTDATVITDSAQTAFVGVAGLCVGIGTFFVVYRIVKKIK